MTIDYIGPAGSFEPVTYSLVDVVQGAVPAERLRGKYVLIGATAASQGDRVASPFLHQTDAHADQHGVLMPGVEVLANALNTILRARFYSETGDLSAFLWAAADRGDHAVRAGTRAGPAGDRPPGRRAVPGRLRRFSLRRIWNSPA